MVPVEKVELSTVKIRSINEVKQNKRLDQRKRNRALLNITHQNPNSQLFLLFPIESR